MKSHYGQGLFVWIYAVYQISKIIFYKRVIILLNNLFWIISGLYDRSLVTKDYRNNPDRFILLLFIHLLSSSCILLVYLVISTFVYSFLTAAQCNHLNLLHSLQDYRSEHSWNTTPLEALIIHQIFIVPIINELYSMTDNSLQSQSSCSKRELRWGRPTYCLF